MSAQPLGGLEIMGMAENAIRHAMKLLEEAREVLDAELKHVGATPAPYAPGRDWAGRPTAPVLYRRVRESELEDRAVSHTFDHEAAERAMVDNFGLSMRAAIEMAEKVRKQFLQRWDPVKDEDGGIPPELRR